MRRIYRVGFGGCILGVAFACSGDPKVSNKGNSFPSGSNGGSSGAGKSGSGSGGSGNSKGNVVVVGGSTQRGESPQSNTGDGTDVPVIPTLPDASFDYDPAGTNDRDACAVVNVEASPVKRPIDIIISVDNSGSMSGEISAVQSRINQDFSAIIAAADVDYRVIMVSRYGKVGSAVGSSDHPICIRSPLGGHNCSNPNKQKLANNPPIFYHYSADIESRDMWCRLLDGYSNPDESGGTRTNKQPHYPWPTVFPNGYRTTLREGSFKIILAISDDRNRCKLASINGADFNDESDDNGLTAAQDFDRVLRTLAPNHFGAYDPQAPNRGRNYRYYAIVGLEPRADNPATPDDERRIPFGPDEPLVTNNCSGGENVGWGHQQLAILTGGLRYSNCLNDDFDAMFRAVAQGVIDGSLTACEYDVPVPEKGVVDLAKTTVTYLPGGSAPGVLLPRVANPSACGNSDGFYFNGAGDKLFLCPSSCATIRDNAKAKINLSFGCLGS